MNTETFMLVVAIAFSAGALLYFIALAFAFIFNTKSLSGFRKVVESNLAFNIDILTAGLGSFGVVAIFWSAFSSGVGSNKTMMLEFMGLKFSGPSGPITLWVLCFLSIVLAMHLLGKKDK